MIRTLPVLRFFDYANNGKLARISNARFVIMAKRQSSMRPSAIYPRLDSVDLGDDIPTEDAATKDVLKDINFENYVDTFRNKTTWEIFRALAVLKLCSVNFLVDNSLGIMKWVERRCGKRALRVLCRPLFYNQFVGGETPEEIRSCIRRLAESGVRSILAASMEEDIGEGGDENVYNNNCQRILESIDIAMAEDTRSPMVQVKLSGLLQAELLVILGNIYKNSSDKLKLIKVISEALQGNNLDMSLLPDVFDDTKKEALRNAVQRWRKIGQEAVRKGVIVLVDAEYTYLNRGLSFLTLAAVDAFNKKSAAIWNTYQCYLKDVRKKLDEEMQLVTKDLQAFFGAKLVRGAYMVQERQRAQKLQISDPVCEDYEATSANYNSTLQYLMDKLPEIGSKCQFIVASHNEDSVKLAIKRMSELSIDKERGGVCFGQLYGMCDQVSNPLANAGFAIYKSVPFGTVEEVVPYLARRAIENRSVLEGARKELFLLNKEFSRRVKRKLTCRSSAVTTRSTQAQ